MQQCRMHLRSGGCGDRRACKSGNYSRFYIKMLRARRTHLGVVEDVEETAEDNAEDAVEDAAVEDAVMESVEDADSESTEDDGGGGNEEEGEDPGSDDELFSVSSRVVVSDIFFPTLRQR